LRPATRCCFGETSRSIPSQSGTNQAIVKTIDRAQELQGSEPLVALEAYANAARDSLRELESNPANTEARRCYNFAVAGIFSVVRQAKLDPWTKPVRFGTNSELTLTGTKDPAKPEQNPHPPSLSFGVAGDRIENRKSEI